MQDSIGDSSPEPPRDSDSDRSQTSHLWYEVRLCLGFLTRVPVFSVEYSGHSSLASAAWAFPLVGVIVGFIGAVGLWLTDAFGLGAQLSAMLAIALMMILTGALHEDGLADTADGFGVTGDAEKRLSIMHDPRIGVFGMAALIVIFCGRWLALGDLMAISFWDGIVALIAASAISRGVLPFVMHTIPNARTEGLSFAAGRPEAQPAWIALAISATIGLLAFGFGGTIFVLLVVGIVTYAISRTAQRLIGGQNGDVLGAIQQLAEVSILVTAAGLAA
jgi:adenosylcobinamide-GDP ribazoletransferase